MRYSLVASPATYMFLKLFLSIVSLIKFVLSIVARLVRIPTLEVSFSFFYWPSRFNCPLFIASILIIRQRSRFTSLLARIFIPRQYSHFTSLIVCREDSDSSRASSSRLIPREYPHFPHPETY